MKKPYIESYIGTVTVSEYGTVRRLITPILKRFGVGLRGRGRGHRLNRQYYQSYLPLNLSTKIGLYIRISDKVSYHDRTVFEKMVCPIIRDEIRTTLKTDGVNLERVVS